MKALAALGSAGLLSLAAATAAAGASVDGCDVTLTNPGTEYVDVYGGPDDGWMTFAVDGPLTLTLASGSYRAEWDDGTVETFKLACDDAGYATDPDYDPAVTPGPEPTDPPEDVVDPTPFPTPEGDPTPTDPPAVTNASYPHPGTLGKHGLRIAI